jgi:hypothetical protein
MNDLNEVLSAAVNGNGDLDAARRRGEAITPDVIHVDRLPPHSEEMERAVLGCILQAPGESLNRLAERRCSAEWFYDRRHQTIFRAITALQ